MGEAINRYLDAAVLYPELERDKAREAIRSIVQFECRTACIRPCDIDMAVELCRDSATDVCVVLSFPHGCGLSRVKRLEAHAYLDDGVDEIDMVANYGFIRSERWDLVEQDIRAVSEVTQERASLLKVILETSELTTEQIKRATECAVAAQADYVKTSTGFASGGATVETVRAMLEAADGRIEVKASGGIRDYAQAKTYIDMGATRLGVGYPVVATICTGGPGTDLADY
jgi:deoxyribose-phosphate aldolase